MVDWTKPVRTRDGRAARVLCTDANRDYPVIALIDEGKGERLEQYCADGSFLANRDGPTESDLVNARERVTYFVNWYAPAISTAAVCLSRADADEHEMPQRQPRRTAVLSIITEDGVPIAVEVERVKP